jgi:hypothetical protein
MAIARGWSARLRLDIEQADDSQQNGLREDQWQDEREGSR